MAAVHASLGLHYLRMGRNDEAIAEIGKEGSAGYRDYGLAIAHHVIGNSEPADAALARLLTHGDQWGYQFASVYAVRGERDQAFHWLERSYELHDSGVVLTKVTHWFENLHSDPRWPRFLEKIGLAD